MRKQCLVSQGLRSVKGGRQGQVQEDCEGYFHGLSCSFYLPSCGAIVKYSVSQESFFARACPSGTDTRIISSPTRHQKT
jgi:hypothetical protein